MSPKVSPKVKSPLAGSSARPPPSLTCKRKSPAGTAKVWTSSIASEKGPAGLLGGCGRDLVDLLRAKAQSPRAAAEHRQLDGVDSRCWRDGLDLRLAKADGVRLVAIHVDAEGVNAAREGHRHVLLTAVLRRHRLDLLNASGGTDHFPSTHDFDAVAAAVHHEVVSRVPKGYLAAGVDPLHRARRVRRQPACTVVCVDVHAGCVALQRPVARDGDSGRPLGLEALLAKVSVQVDGADDIVPAAEVEEEPEPVRAAELVLDGRAQFPHEAAFRVDACDVEAILLSLVILRHVHVDGLHLCAGAGKQRANLLDLPLRVGGEEGHLLHLVHIHGARRDNLHFRLDSVSVGHDGLHLVDARHGGSHSLALVRDFRRQEDRLLLDDHRRVHDDALQLSLDRDLDVGCCERVGVRYGHCNVANGVRNPIGGGDHGWRRRRRRASSDAVEGRDAHVVRHARLQHGLLYARDDVSTSDRVLERRVFSDDERVALSGGREGRVGVPLDHVVRDGRATVSPKLTKRCRRCFPSEQEPDTAGRFQCHRLRRPGSAKQARGTRRRRQRRR
eukprot:scaffold1102_cov256-Pinguiococcus_pyrenoidosus.AAC.11